MGQGGEKRWFQALAALAILWTLPAWGSGPKEFMIQNWTREHGLPGNTVTGVAQTPDGYLWAGTFGGLARFDGVKFATIDIGKHVGPQHSMIVSLAADSRGTLWAASGDGCLVEMNRGWVASHVPPSHETADRPVRRVAQAADGALWILNYEGKLSRRTDDIFQEVAERPDFVTLAADASRRIWVAARDELMLDAGDKLICTWDARREPGFRPEALALARAGGCWVVSNGRLRRFEAGEPRETRGQLETQLSHPSGLVEDHEGNLWISTYGAGLAVVDKDGVSRHLGRAQGLPSDLVRCVFEDDEGNIWAGLEGRGLACIRRGTFVSYGRAEGMSGETVLCACEGEDGEVWIGTNGDGVYRIKAGEVQRFGASEGLSNPFVWSLCYDRAGRLWAGTWGGGLFKMENRRFASAQPEPAEPPVVLAIYQDTRGTLWLGKRIVNGCRIEAIERGELRSYAVPGESRGIDLRCIAETPDGSLWFGTADDGLLRRKNGVLTRCTAAQGLPPGPISCLHVDDDGDLWVAVDGTGLVLWEQERFKSIKAARALLDDNLGQITDDGLGRLWCGLRTGVVLVRKEDLRRLARGGKSVLEWRRFSKADGLPANECGGEGMRARDGHIWFPTASGMAVVDPRRAVTDPAPPAAVMESVLLGGKPARISSELPREGAAKSHQPAGDGLSAGFPPPSFFVVPPGSWPLDIAYTALRSTAPERVRFRYQLSGLDESPVEAGGARLVRYSHLPPGKYKFLVSASNEGGEWSETGAALAFEVMPRYWQTLWFRLAALGAMMGGTFGTARWVITRRLRRRMAELEKQRALEAERSRIAQDLHDDLGTSLTEINFLSAAAGSPSSSAAEVKESLESISGKSVDLVKALDEIVWAVNPKNDSLKDLVNYVCLFAQDFLKSTPIQCRLDVPQGLPGLPLNADQRHTLFLVTKEALANAAKHSAATEVRLRVRFDGSRLTLIVEDNGHGFDPAIPKPGRNGLKNIQDRMAKLGGRATFHSAPSEGTRVELELQIAPHR